MPPSSHPPRPQPPPAPRPVQRSYERAGATLTNQNYYPPPPLVHTNYSDLVNQNIQHNHNGGRQLAGGPAGGQHRRHRRSPDTMTRDHTRDPTRDLPPVRSVSQHRLGTAEEMQDYYELRPRIPDLSEDFRHETRTTDLTRERTREHTRGHHNNNKSGTHHRIPDTAHTATSPSSANYKNLVQNKNSSKLLDKQEGSDKVVNDDTIVHNDSEKFNLATSITSPEKIISYNSRTLHSSSNTRGGGKSQRTKSDAVLLEYHCDNKEDHLDAAAQDTTVIPNSNYHQTEIHPTNSNSINPVKSMKETGAIPKKKKTAPLSSPLTIHPDEIISVPLDTELSPNMRASTHKQRYNNYAH